MRDPSPAPDETGWPAALLDAYDANRLPLVRLSFLMTGDREAAEDIVQEVFLATRQRWTGIRNLKPYLRAAVANRSRSWLRRKRLERRESHSAEATYDAAPDEMWDALAELTPRQRVAVVLRFYEGLPDAEIASVLRCREATVRTTIHRALAALRKEITR